MDRPNQFNRFVKRDSYRPKVGWQLCFRFGYFLSRIGFCHINDGLNHSVELPADSDELLDLCTRFVKQVEAINAVNKNWRDIQEVEPDFFAIPRSSDLRLHFHQFGENPK